MTISQLKNSINDVVDYSVDSFEDYYLYAWIGLVLGGLLSALLIVVVVYVL